VLGDGFGRVVVVVFCGLALAIAVVCFVAVLDFEGTDVASKPGRSPSFIVDGKSGLSSGVAIVLDGGGGCLMGSGCGWQLAMTLKQIPAMMCCFL
jgi:hypothetical protein